jgi:hypothetical protein
MSDQTQATTEDGDMENMSELQLLKRRASLLGITHSNNISVATLRAKIEAKLNGEPEVKENEEINPLGAVDSPATVDDKNLTVRERLRLKHMRLIRCRIQCLDPKKKDLRGEIFTIGNEVLGTVRKFVPFGEVTDGGFHIPYCIYRMMESRKFVNITITKERGTGRETVKTSMAKEFAIEVLPPLTPQQLARLATAQAAAGSVDEVAA